MQLTFVGPVGQRRHRRTQLSYAVGLPQYLVHQRHALILHLLGFCARHQPWKVNGTLVIPGSVRTLDVAKLALETEIDDLVYVLGLELLGFDLGIFLVRTVGVDGIEKFRKATAVSHAQTAVGAEAKDAFGFRAQVFLVVITRIGRVISGIVAHRYTPLMIIPNNS